MNMKEEIIKLFTNSLELEKLSGGQEESFKSNNIVIKPIYEVEKYLWHANELEKIDFNEIQYSKPVKSKNGNYIEDLHCATSFIEGDFHEGKIKEKIQAANKFNCLIKDIQKPKDFNKWISPWTKAQDIAWDKCKIPKETPKIIKEVLEELNLLKKDINLKDQLIHCDYAGNILFNEKGPIIIDFSPGYYPPEYSIACLIVDSIAWHNSTIEVIKYFEAEDFIKYQLILRAVIFRLLVPYYFDPTNTEIFKEEYSSFLPVIEWLKTNG